MYICNIYIYYILYILYIYYIYVYIYILYILYIYYIYILYIIYYIYIYIYWFLSNLQRLDFFLLIYMYVWKNMKDMKEHERRRLGIHSSPMGN